MFHGGRCGKPIPIFRGFNYNIENTNVLSISDPTYKRYNKLNVAWYMNTKKYQTLRDDIEEIIRNVQNITSAKCILFVAQCSGSMIASYLGGRFKQSVLITNPHLILRSTDTKPYYHFTDKVLRDGHIINKENKRIEVWIGYLAKNMDGMLDMDELDTRKLLKKYGFPKKYYIYAHKDDYTAEWIKKIKEECDRNTQNCEIILHDTKTHSPHHCPLPNNGKLLNYIKKHLKELH